MAKKGQASSRDGPSSSSSKKPVAVPATIYNNEPDIVFTNSLGDARTKSGNVAKGSKGKATEKKDSSSGGGRSSGNNEAAASAAAAAGETLAKRPDTRTLIGGASWTGKLPVNLLSEHCQKQKWEKPEYTMVWCPFILCPFEEMGVGRVLSKNKI
jgi:hypothetical protein